MAVVCLAIEPRIPTTVPGQSTSGFHRPGRRRVRQNTTTYPEANKRQTCLPRDRVLGVKVILAVHLHQHFAIGAKKEAGTIAVREKVGTSPQQSNGAVV